ncbi:hypothetical protein SHB62_002403 [Vibrio cholerae]|nr:hypothetical protein [Vibrio cholerae]ELV5029688.1 hypothetical protein [Vibrio cholerae]
MNDKYVKLSVQEFAKNSSPDFKKTYEIDGEYYTISIQKEKRMVINESLIKSSTTISALPSGSPCRSCGGSGISSY